jgi:general secretion pathway protein H
MRTSATGIAEAGASQRRSARDGSTPSWRSAEHGSTPSWRSAEHGFTPLRRSAEHGFTLVELLVVLTIIGLMSAAVVLALPDPRGGLVGEAERFAARAKAAQERAIMDNRSFALRVTPQGYGFERRQGREWQALEQKPFSTIAWKEGTAASLGAGQDRIVFDPTGYAEPLDLTLSRGGEQVTVEIADGGRIHVRG